MKTDLLSDLLLIAQNPEKPRSLASDMHLNFSLIGAFILELTFIEKVKVEGDHLIFNELGTDNDPTINLIYEKIRSISKKRKTKYWVHKLSRYSRKLKRMVLDDLANKGMLKVEHKKFLGIIPYTRSSLIDRPKRDLLIHELKDLIVHQKSMTQHQAALITLIQVCKLSKIFSQDKKERKELEKKMKEFIKNDPIASSVDKTITEVQTAIMASIVASTAASASSH